MKNVRTILILSCCLGGLLLQTGCDIQLGSWSQAKYERTIEWPKPATDPSPSSAPT